MIYLYFLIFIFIFQLFEIYCLYKIEKKIQDNVNKVVLQIEEKPLQRKTRLTKNAKTRKNIKVEKEGK